MMIEVELWNWHGTLMQGKKTFFLLCFTTQDYWYWSTKWDYLGTNSV